jgi:alpha-tubulin suppressor-like RCC1 family protein
MDSSTINTTNIALADSNGNPISGAVSYSSNVAIFNPSSDLSYSTIYTFTVGTGVKDNAGNALGSSFSSNFITIDLPTAISNGTNLTCALLSNKTIKCWGNTGGGQAGDTDSTSRTTPVTVSGISTATAVSGGGRNSCALLIDKTIQCWGYNYYGQLGDNSTTYSSTPVTVSGISNAIAVSNGSNHTCALLSDGTIKCWGQNGDWGQLGDNSTTNRMTPVTVSGVSNAIAITVSKASHTCALLSDGTIKCWGLNNYGQLGDNSTTNRMTPVTVPGISSATAVSAGHDHTCALLSDSTIKCWGLDSWGQLGDGDPNANSTTPVTVSGISTAIAVTSGRSHTCALLSNNTTQCWGYNYYGQLGDNSRILEVQQRNTPVTVSGISNAIAISAGDYHNCALLSNNTAQCWGSNGVGQLGNGKSGYSSSKSTPVTVQF